MASAAISERGIHLKIKDLPLDQKIGKNSYAPTAAQVRALADIFYGRPIPEEVRRSIFDQARDNQDGLEACFKLYDETTKMGLNKTPEDIAMNIAFMADSIIISTKPTSLAEIKVRKLQLAAGIQVALAEEILK